MKLLLLVALTTFSAPKNVVPKPLRVEGEVCGKKATELVYKPVKASKPLGGEPQELKVAEGLVFQTMVATVIEPETSKIRVVTIVTGINGKKLDEDPFLYSVLVPTEGIIYVLQLSLDGPSTCYTKYRFQE